MMSLAVVVPQEAKEVTASEKKAFLELIKMLPTKGEFFTDEAIEKAASHTRVLLALTQKDIGKHDLYPFLALSRGLLNRKEQREFGVKHFGKISHPEIKLFWGVVLFDAKAASPEIVNFLRTALESKQQSKILSEIVGPNFRDFEQRVRKFPLKEK